jgi:hypothetical protein
MFTKPKAFKDSAFYKIPFPDELRRWIELIQPCNGALSKGTEFEFWNIGLKGPQ